MPALDFKGKSFIYTHHLGVPYRELLMVPEKSCPAEGKQPDLDDNLILHGDNLEALKALLPRYAGRVDCIYIDPPYNTGTEGWCSNDAVNACYRDCGPTGLHFAMSATTSSATTNAIQISALRAGSVTRRRARSSAPLTTKKSIGSARRWMRVSGDKNRFPAP